MQYSEKSIGECPARPSEGDAQAEAALISSKAHPESCSLVSSGFITSATSPCQPRAVMRLEGGRIKG